MRAYKLAEIEAKFAKDLVDAYGKKWKTGPSEIAGGVGLIGNGNSFYYTEKTAKTLTMHHCTCGVITGDIGALSQPNNHVSVHFVVARDGTIYQLFNTDYWSYHLGSGATGGNGVVSKASVAIEYSNIGPLTLTKNNVLVDSYGKDYCTLSDTQYYVKLAAPYRKWQYFATYTDAQYAAAKKIIAFAESKHKIPHTFLPTDKDDDFYKQLPKVGNLTHANVRIDKVDVGPAWDWTKVK